MAGKSLVPVCSLKRSHDRVVDSEQVELNQLVGP
jgi:hypothetical protein